MSNTETPTNIAALADLSEKWKFRFAFFDKYGVPGLGKPSPEYVAAMKAMGAGERIKIGMNFIALFFSGIYLLILGLWKKALLLVAISIILQVVLALLGMESIARGVTVGLSVYCGMRTNVWYFQKRVLGIHNWSL